MKKIKEVRNLYVTSVNLYVDIFCINNKVYTNGWIADTVGTLLTISDMVLDFQDIKFCVDNDISFDWLQHWYFYNYENYKTKSINLKSYCSLRKNQDLTDETFTKYLDEFLK